MLYSVKKSIEEGWGKLKWFSTVLSERIKVEIAVIKLLRESADLEKARETLAMGIGDRVFELRKSPDISIYEDSKISAALRELEDVDAKLLELKKRATEISEAE